MTRSSLVFGTDSTVAERVLVFVAAATGLAIWIPTALGEPWPWWLWLVGAVVVFDLTGGVVSLGLDAAKRFHRTPPPEPRTRIQRLLHDKVGFAAVHVQPIAVGLLFGGPWWWGLLWYGWALAGVLLVGRVPAHLARPVGLLVLLAGLMTAPAVPAPAGFGWLPAVLLLKLVVGHAVPEQPR
ncbi:hypothetical protein [Saccharopolyspora taberi]|uniref:Uncharacterized protein n=1 Tax=Saccharopolyspora taberi TaxID=60895 RepID=A0ABN3V325_9PSEU